MLGAAAFVAERYVPHTFINRDGRFYANTNVTLVEGPTLEQPFCRSWYDDSLGWNRNLDPGWSNIALGGDGEYLPKHPALMPILSTPLFWAFGLDGTLLFNVLCIFVIGVAGYVFARRYAPAEASAVAAMVLVAGTSIGRIFAYDYHVDVLLLALFLSGLAAVVTRRGLLAGILVGMTVTLKPTVLMWVPSLALLAWERKDRRVLVRAMIGGAIVLALWAGWNTWLFGRPWWAGYSRTLVRVNDVAQVADHIDNFNTPFWEGLHRTLFGVWGLRFRFALFVLAFPGWFVLARRRRVFVLAAVMALAFATYIFAIYDWPGDRFMWPAIAFQLPALAAFLGWVARRGRTLFAGRLSALGSPHMRPIVAGAVVALAAVLLRLPFDVPDGPYEEATGMLASGHADLRALLPPGVIHDRSVSMGTHVSEIATWRDGSLWPRTSVPAAVLSAPMATLGETGLLAWHAFLALMFVGGLGWIASALPGRARPVASVGAASATLLVLLPGLDARLAAGGPGLYAAVFAGLSLVSAARLRERGSLGLALLSGIFAGLASWMLEVPTPLALAPAVLVGLHARGCLRPFAVGLGGALGLAMLVNLVTWGRPFASADDFVVVAGSSGSFWDSPRIVVADLFAATQWPGTGRAFVPVWVAAALGVMGLASVALIQRSRELAGWLAVFVIVGATGLVPGVVDQAGGEPPLLLFLVAAPAIAFGVSALARALKVAATRLGSRGIMGLGLAAVVLLGVIGSVQRTRAAEAPFRFESMGAVRDAEVLLGSSRVRCDFLAWEHFSWECASFDRDSPMGLVGLATSHRHVVAGERVEGFVLSTGFRGRSRQVTWSALRGDGGALAIEYAVPEGHPGGGRLIVTIDGEERARLQLSATSTPFTRQEVPVPTGPFELVITHESPHRQRSVAILRGGIVPAAAD